ncbi:hypothetical protein JCM10450v2_003791 [Rhodotorula kratochvilovae]
MSTSSTTAEDDSAWHREGPIRLLQDGQWRRKNGPVACDLKRRVRCSGYETGAPCDSCIRRNAECVIGDDTYAPDAPAQTTIFIPILPPPAAPCASPISPSRSAFSFDVDALCDALESSAPRPAPLVWKSPHDSLAPSGGSARGLRQKRPALHYADEPGTAAQVVRAAHPSRKRRAPSPLHEFVVVVDDADTGNSCGYAFEPSFEPVLPPQAKRARRASPHRRPQVVRLNRHVPAHAAPPLPRTGLAVFSASTSRLVGLAEYKLEARGAPAFEKRTRFTSRYPLSSARDDPLPARVASPAPLSSSAHHPSARRDSLVSTASTAGALSSIFSGRRGSLETSVSGASAGEEEDGGGGGGERV